MNTVKNIRTIDRELIEQLVALVPDDAKRIMHKLMKQFIGVGIDHGLGHCLSVARRTKQLLGDVPMCALIVAMLAAGGHEADDSKLAGYIERGRRCREILAKHPYGELVAWVIQHIGVSKEATRNYDQPKWSKEKWLELVKLVALPAEFTPELLLWVRHCVSCADMLHSTGSEAQIRSVEYARRQITEKLGECPMPELRRQVRDIHFRKHLHMINWCHLDEPEVRELFITGAHDLVRDYNKWCLENGGSEDELL